MSRETDIRNNFCDGFLIKIEIFNGKNDHVAYETYG